MRVEHETIKAAIAHAKDRAKRSKSSMTIWVSGAMVFVRPTSDPHELTPLPKDAKFYLIVYPA